MAECFDGAAIRHLGDGRALYADRRLANADQLFGFATECAIKFALTALPGCSSGSSLAGRYQKHIDKLWGLVPLQSTQKRFPNLVKVLKGLQQPFLGWSTDQRYEPDSAVADDAVVRHFEAARRVLGAVGLTGTRRKA